MCSTPAPILTSYAPHLLVSGAVHLIDLMPKLHGALRSTPPRPDPHPLPCSWRFTCAPSSSLSPRHHASPCSAM